MQPEIEFIEEKKLVGISREMSLAKNTTYELFRIFMPRRKEIANVMDNTIIDLRTYTADYFTDFNPAVRFIKYALVEVTSCDTIPDKMKHFILGGGKYAIFRQSKSPAGTKIFEYIFGEWFPNSDYEVDHRPHFEILTENQNNTGASEEIIHIPIKDKEEKNNALS